MILLEIKDILANIYISLLATGKLGSGESLSHS